MLNSAANYNNTDNEKNNTNEQHKQTWDKKSGVLFYQLSGLNLSVLSNDS